MMASNKNRKHKGDTARTRHITLCLLASMAIAVSCSSIDCPMDSLVYTQYQLMKPDGSRDTLKRLLTVSTSRTTDGSDTVLVNMNANTTELSLPISYSQPEDVFYFEVADTASMTSQLDTVTVAKTDQMHFESVDCSPLYFHTLTAVSTTHNAIDSIVIINPDVTYDISKKHFNIYFKPRD